MNLAQEPLGVDDVLDDLAREHHLHGAVLERQLRGHRVPIEDVDVVDERIRPAGTRSVSFLGVDLDRAEPHTRVGEEALEELSATASEVDDGAAVELPELLTQQPMHLGIAMLVVEEEPFLVAPVRAVGKVE